MNFRYRGLALVPFASLLMAGMPAPDSASEVNLTRLVLRDREISISRGASGIQYDLYGPNGRLIDSDLTVTQLQAEYPDIYDRLRPAVAGSEAEPTLMMVVPRNLDQLEP